MRQLTSGTLNLPVGILADAFGRHQAAMLGSAIAFMGLGYYVMGATAALGGALVGAALVGLGSAIWHPPAMGALSVRFPERRATVLAIHGVGATVADTLTPVAIGALFVAFAWPGVLRAQLWPALVSGLLLWRGLAGQFREGAARPSGQALARDVRAILV